MPFCPECQREYLSGEKTCAFCNVELVDELPLEALPDAPKIEYEPGELVTIIAFNDLMEARAVRNMLIDNGVLCLLSDGSNSEDGPEYTLHVKEDDVFRANSLLVPYMEKPEIDETETAETKEQPVNNNMRQCPQCRRTKILAVNSSFFGGRKWQCQNCGLEWNLK
ncbi:MAG: hypothetical protein PHE50_07550 [Dehalococcoidales bacterium]|nr:hypothetical protein [Dehalococcoidales bacterium]